MIALCKDPSGGEVFNSDMHLQEQEKTNFRDVEGKTIEKTNAEINSWLISYEQQLSDNPTDIFCTSTLH